MYQWIRNTHLFLGLFFFLFLLMYGVSAIQMSHNRWFTAKPTVTESGLAVSPNGGDARAVARELMDRHGLRGELRQVQQTETGFRFRIVRAGTFYEVEYARQSGEAKVRTTAATFMGMLNRIHHINGLWHDYAPFNIWGFLLGLVSAGLIVSALTGIYLWFKIHTERVIGIILLAISLGYSLTVMILLRAA